VYAGLRAGHGDADDLADVAVRQPLDIAQHDHRAILGAARRAQRSKTVRSSLWTDGSSTAADQSATAGTPKGRPRTGQIRE